MKKISCLIVAILLASCASRPTEPQAPPEPTTPFEGTWREIRNQHRPVRAKKTWTFMGDMITIEEGEDSYTGNFAYNEDTDPQEIDFFFEGYPPNEAIYELKGNRLMMKLLQTATMRSNKLRYERGYLLIMCLREKGEEPPKEE